MTATSRAKYRTIGRRQRRCAVRRGRGDPRRGSRHQEAAQQRPTTMGDEQQTCASWKKIRRGDAGNTPWLNPEHAGEQGFVRAALNPSREAGAGKLRRSWGARWPWLGAPGELRQVAASSEEQTRGGRGSRAQLDTGLGMKPRRWGEGQARSELGTRPWQRALGWEHRGMSREDACRRAPWPDLVGARRAQRELGRELGLGTGLTAGEIEREQGARSWTRAMEIRPSRARS
jgi:hypothetical protein